tara:strand:+ start:442 stop:576 length:135 start_codon:yes stop_codon:yes gene_type:complete
LVDKNEPATQQKGAWQSQAPSMLRLKHGAVVLTAQRLFQDRASA